MIFAINMGNTHITIGCLDDDSIIFSERISMEKRRTALEYAVTFKTVLELYGIDPKQIEGAIISSVVPPALQAVSEAVEKVVGTRPMVVGPGLKTGLNIRMDDPKSVGSDLIVAAVSAINKYGGPLILADLGTATTLSVVDKDNCYIGGVISLGVRLSMEALASNTAQLYRVGLEKPSKAICKNTIDSMNSGILMGAACTVDGMIDRMEKELGYSAKKIATGVYADMVIPLCNHDIISDENLVMEGLRIIYHKNK